ncbi:MAG: hypothetical protein NZ602_09090 [Thermoguttaceae bacterium]|nr:hypothetical protein [Thermoguttaceae bacterium]
MRGEHLEQQNGQKTFASLGFEQHRKSTRRHEFLRTMNRVMPWQELARLVEAYSGRKGYKPQIVSSWQVFSGTLLPETARAGSAG